MRLLYGFHRSDGQSARKEPQFPASTDGAKRDLVTVSVGREVNDVEAGQNGDPVGVEEDGARRWDSAMARCARA